MLRDKIFIVLSGNIWDLTTQNFIETYIRWICTGVDFASQSNFVPFD